MWLIELINVIKRDLIGRLYAKSRDKKDCMQKIKDLNQEILKLSAFKPLLYRLTDIVAYKLVGYRQSKVISFG